MQNMTFLCNTSRKLNDGTHNFFLENNSPDDSRDNWITSIHYCIIVTIIAFSILLNMNYQPILSIQKSQNSHD